MRAGNLDEVRQILIEVTNLFVASSSNQSIVDVPERWVTLFCLTHNGEVAASLIGCTGRIPQHRAEDDP